MRELPRGAHTVPPQAALPNPALPGTLTGALHRAAQLGTARDGVTFLGARGEETRLSWAQVEDRALRAGAALAAHGVRPGDRVALVLPTAPAFLDAFFGALAVGAVPVPLYPPRNLGRLAEYHARTATMLQACGAAAVVADGPTWRLLGETVRQASPRLGVLSAESLTRPAPEPALALDEERLALVQFTSGTSHRPRPVALTHLQVLANTDAVAGFMPLDARDPDGHPYDPVGVSWLPLYHDMGLIGALLVALRRPGPLTLIPPEQFLFRPATWLRAISDARATVSLAPNFAFALCVERVRDEELEGVDLSSWRFALNGAEPVNPWVLRRFQHRFSAWGLRPSALTPVYGLSEAALAVSSSDPWRPFRARAFRRDALARGRAREVRQELRIGVQPTEPDPRVIELASVGRPLRGYGVEVRDEDGVLQPPGRLGRVWVAGPSLMEGYLDAPDSPIHDGWLDTGDLGFIHEGDLYITGRAEDIIVLGGEQHTPPDLEAAVDEVPGVRPGCAAAVGAPGPDGTRLVLFVEYRQQRPSLADECQAAVRAATGLDPDLVVLVPPGTLPRTSSGKIRRGEALRRWQLGELQPPNAVTPFLVAGALARSAWGYLWARKGDEGEEG